MYGNTVKEAALEQELANLRRENADLRHKLMGTSAHNAEMWMYNREPPPDAEIKTSFPAPATLRLAAEWQANKDERGGLHLTGIARTNTGDKFSVGYYVSAEEMYCAHDALGLLGFLHERVIRILADEYLKIKK